MQEIPTLKQESKPKIDFFHTGMGDNDLEELEKDFQMNRKEEPFGKSINREQLQASKKEIEKELKQKDSKSSTGGKKNLQIDIEDNDDYDTQNSKAQQNMNEKLQKIEANHHGNPLTASDPIEGEYEEINEEELLDEFNAIYNHDAELRQMLGDDPDRYSIEEKLSIVQAYKKGGGVAGLAEIIDDEDEDEA